MPNTQARLTPTSVPTPRGALSSRQLSPGLQHLARVAGLARGALPGRGLAPGLQQEEARAAGLPRGALPGRRLSQSPTGGKSSWSTTRCQELEVIELIGLLSDEV